MDSQAPERLGIIAGNGSYPLLLAESAKRRGVNKLFAVAFCKETDKTIANLVDDVEWVQVGQLQRILDALGASGVKHAVMAGQLTPTSLFRVRLDKKAISVLGSLRERNADTIFSAVASELAELGIELLRADAFMESNMAEPGVLTARGPSESENRDIKLGLRVARTTSDLDIGQTVVIKNGSVLAVEAFEGTDDTILRAGRLGGEGSVVVKTAKPGHDMRFDIPVVGLRTMKVLKKAGSTALALEAGRSILLEKDEFIVQADRAGICVVAVDRGEGTDG